MKKKLAVVGATSMVGSRFCEQAQTYFDLIQSDLHGRSATDITDKRSVEVFFQKYDFDWLILFAAFTDVDAAEKQRHAKNSPCWQINFQGAANIASACAQSGRGLIFISTDFVFDGTAGPYSEDAPTGSNLDKVSWYGISKLKAEETVSSTVADALIVRIAYPYRAHFSAKDDFAKHILRRYRKQQLYPMFSDQILTPTFIDDLFPLVVLLLSKKHKGIFHLASPDSTTPYEFAKYLIATFGGRAQDVKKGSLSEFLSRPHQTPRPIKGGLKVAQIKKLGFVPTAWQQGIRAIYAQSNGQLI